MKAQRKTSNLKTDRLARKVATLEAEARHQREINARTLEVFRAIQETLDRRRAEALYGPKVAAK